MINEAVIRDSEYKVVDVFGDLPKNDNFVAL